MDPDIRPPAVPLETKSGESRFIIDPRNYRKDKIVLGCLLMFAIVPILPLAGLFFLPWGSGWLVVIGFALFMNLIIWCAGICQRNRKDILEVHPSFLEIRKDGSALPTRLPRGTTLYLTLEWVDDGGDSVESFATLNLWHKPAVWQTRHMLAHYLTLADKERIFHELLAFLTAHGFPVKWKNDRAKKRKRLGEEIIRSPGFPDSWKGL